MRKVLILAYDSPPYVSVGGLRPFSWFRFLPESGVFPVVITRQWSNKYGNHLDFVSPGDSAESPGESWSLIETEFHDLEPVVQIHPKAGNERLLEKLASNNVFLLFNNYSYMGTKIYDYLGLKRRIILCYGNDKEARALKEKYFHMGDKDETIEQPQRKVLSETLAGVIGRGRRSPASGSRRSLHGISNARFYRLRSGQYRAVFAKDSSRKISRGGGKSPGASKRKIFINQETDR